MQWNSETKKKVFLQVIYLHKTIKMHENVNYHSNVKILHISEFPDIQLEGKNSEPEIGS